MIQQSVSSSLKYLKTVTDNPLVIYLNHVTYNYIYVHLRSKESQSIYHIQHWLRNVNDIRMH